MKREAAFCLFSEDLAPPPVAVPAFRRIMQAARDRRCPIMVFVGNHGAIQIHSGLVHHLKVVGPWFNLHVREERLARAWIVRKPTDGGWVTSLELFDIDGRQVLQLLGVREPGQPESDSWRDILARSE